MSKKYDLIHLLAVDSLLTNELQDDKVSDEEFKYIEGQILTMYGHELYGIDPEKVKEIYYKFTEDVKAHRKELIQAFKERYDNE